MRPRLLIDSWLGRALLVAIALTTVGVGFCLFDGDHHHAFDNGPSLDLCCGLAIVSVSMIALTVAPTHLLPCDPPYVIHAVPLHRLDPPPKLPALS